MKNSGWHRRVFVSCHAEFISASMPCVSHPPWERRNWGGFAVCHAELVSASLPCAFFVISSVAIAESRNLLLEDFDKGSLHKVEMTNGKISPQGRPPKAFETGLTKLFLLSLRSEYAFYSAYHLLQHLPYRYGCLLYLLNLLIFIPSKLFKFIRKIEYEHPYGDRYYTRDCRIIRQEIGLCYIPDTPPYEHYTDNNYKIADKEIVPFQR